MSFYFCQLYGKKLQDEQWIYGEINCSDMNILITVLMLAVDIIKSSGNPDRIAKLLFFIYFLIFYYPQHITLASVLRLIIV